MRPSPEPATPIVESLPGWTDPVEILAAFAAEPLPALLFSGSGSALPEDHARWSILCAAPFETLAWSTRDGGDPIGVLIGAVERHPVSPVEGMPFAGGAVGYLGYDAVRGACAARKRRGPGLPDMLFGLYSWAVVWDHQRRSWAVVATGLPESGQARRDKACRDLDIALTRIRSRRRRPSPPDGGAGAPLLAPVLSTSLPRSRYLEMVDEARSLIAEGEVYQVNLSQLLELPPPRDPVAFFADVTRHSAAPFSAFLDAGRFQIVSASPERFLSLKGRIAESRPIKGTSPRGADAREDMELLNRLLRSSKDRAENIMIVDLVRNDLGRVCRVGTVEPAAICRAESFASVHHLVSIVRGEIDEGRGRGDLLRAMFPGGSMTGAPKLAAMRAIDALEPVCRGVYAGALGYLSFCGTMDLSIVIRTAVVSADRTWLQVGGGVVSDSDPEAEYLESLHKAESVRRALAVTASWSIVSRSPRRRGTRTASRTRGR